MENTQKQAVNPLELILSKYPVILQLSRFVAIGIINYSIDALIFNFVSKFFNIHSGGGLGLANIPGFVIAVTQSYFWNHYWAFGGNSGVGIVRNFLRLVFVGGLGFIGFAAVLVGAQLSAQPFYFVLLTIGFVLAEIVLWTSFGLGKITADMSGKSQFIPFLIISVIGLFINTLVVVIASQYLVGRVSVNPDLLKNGAKILATMVSLVWNFLGYKLVVFRK